MLENSLQRAAEIAERYQTAITGAAAIWFWTGIAIYAGFIELSDVPEAARQAFFWSSVAANALWWGYLRPQIEQRRTGIAKDDGEE